MCESGVVHVRPVGGFLERVECLPAERPRTELFPRPVGPEPASKQSTAMSQHGRSRSPKTHVDSRLRCNWWHEG
jgi:hypothetical protein